MKRALGAAVLLWAIFDIGTSGALCAEPDCSGLTDAARASVVIATEVNPGLRVNRLIWNRRS